MPSSAEIWAAMILHAHEGADPGGDRAKLAKLSETPAPPKVATSANRQKSRVLDRPGSIPPQNGAMCRQVGASTPSASRMPCGGFYDRVRSSLGGRPVEG